MRETAIAANGRSGFSSAGFELELLAPRLGYEIELVGMVFDVGADERAKGKDVGPLGAGAGQRLPDQRAPQAPALELGLDLGVDEGDRARAPAVGEVAGAAISDENPQPPRLRVIAELRRRWRPQLVQERHSGILAVFT